MRIVSHPRFWIGLALLWLGAAAIARPLPQTQIVDGIVVRIEDDIITLSELRELAAYQQLLDGRSQANDELRSELIEQWVVDNEANTSRFPSPAQAEVDRETERVQHGFPDAAAYQQRLAAVGLTETALRRIVTRFWKSYVQRKGYREGATGLMLGLFAALYPLISYLKARELLDKEKKS